jgi:hypothetical protein
MPAVRIWAADVITFKAAANKEGLLVLLVSEMHDCY